MNALQAIKPNVWIRRAADLGGAFGGLLIALWWETTTAWTLFNFVLILGLFTPAVLDVYTKRTRSDADAGDAELQSGSQRLIINPPVIAEWFVALIIPKRRSDSLMGDLAERFHRHVETRGLRRAKALYWAEALRSIFPILFAKAKKLGVIAAIAEIWRRTHF